jgi:hypothetical protein
VEASNGPATSPTRLGVPHRCTGYGVETLCNSISMARSHVPRYVPTYTYVLFEIMLYLYTCMWCEGGSESVGACRPAFSLSQLAASQHTRGSQCTCVPFSNQKVVT